MKLYFVGAAHEVTGSCTILYACGKNNDRLRYGAGRKRLREC